MADRTQRDQSGGGLAARHLVLVFLAGVAVCAVFFSLGFFVGYHERTTEAATPTERVSAPPVIPPTVNPPIETVEPEPKTRAPITAPTVPPSEVQPSSQAPATPSSTPPGANQAAAPTASPGPSDSAASGEEVTDAAPPPAPGPKAGEVGGGFTVQVVAARAKQDAEKLVTVLKARGYPVFLVAPARAGRKDDFFRVQVGPFTSRQDAEKVRAKLHQEGFSPFIRH
jgi:DedD protein